VIRPLFVSYLGANTVPIAREISARLSHDLGSELDHVAPDSWTDVTDAIDTGSGWLFWMCGLATVELTDAGRLDAEIVAAPVFRGEPGPVYRSIVVTRSESEARSIDDLAGACLAVNGTSSWSGYHALRAHFAEAGKFGAFFGSVVPTGSHLASIDRLLAGEVDCAAIDSSVWADRSEQDARFGSLRVLTTTRDWPAPPFALSRKIDVMRREAIVASLTRRPPGGLEAIVPATTKAYDTIRDAMTLAARVAW
jgi:ABC-type phosphate/phosphonate transport system substrate-binding protein